MSNKRILGYLRVSGNGQIDGDGFHRQKEAISAFCMTHGFDNIEYAREEGVSGEVEAFERPMLMSLVSSWGQNPDSKPYAVVVEKLDRLARDLMVQECAIRDLKKHGVKLFSAENGLVDMTDDKADPSRTLIRQIFGAIAQYDKASLVHRLQSARRRIRASGKKCEGPYRYGAKDPAEAAIMAKILSMAEAGLSSRHIARTLEFEGIKARNGKPFDDSRVRQMLRKAGRKMELRWYVRDISKLDCTK